MGSTVVLGAVHQFVDLHGFRFMQKAETATALAVDKHINASHIDAGSFTAQRVIMYSPLLFSIQIAAVGSADRERSTMHMIVWDAKRKV